MNKFLVYAVVCLFGMSSHMVYAAVETIRIYPTDDGINFLYDFENLTDWTEARNYTGPLVHITNTDGDNVTVRSDQQSGYFRIYRISLSFDTSLLPDEAIINEASINAFKYAEGNNGGNTDIVFTSHTRQNANLLTEDDWYLSRYGNEFARGELLDNLYTSYSLNFDGREYINKFGGTIFGGMTEFDFDNIPQSSLPRNASFNSSEALGTTTDPYLEITYTVPDVEKSISELISDLKNIVNDQIALKSNRSVYVAQIKVLEQLIGRQKVNTALTHLKVLENQIVLDRQSGVVSIEVEAQMNILLNKIKNQLTLE